MNRQITLTQKKTLEKLGLPVDYMWLINQANDAGFCVEYMAFDEVFEIVTESRNRVLLKRLDQSMAWHEELDEWT